LVIRKKMGKLAAVTNSKIWLPTRDECLKIPKKWPNANPDSKRVELGQPRIIATNNTPGYRHFN